MSISTDPNPLDIATDTSSIDRGPVVRQPAATEALAKPFRLGIVGLGAAIGLFARLSAANGFGDLNSRTLMLAIAATSFVMGLGLAMTAAERDRFGPPLLWITAIASLSWGALNWMSPPFGERVTVWSNPDQIVLAVLGVGNGLLLAGLIALALVRRGPTLTVAATMVAGVMALAANTLLLREEWPAIIVLGVSFFLILLGWDRSPRREQRFAAPEDSPRTSRAALSFISVALCGTALQLWVSRTDVPRSLPAVGLCAVLIAAAFASLIRVRREIERRETTLSEWRSWMREIRTNDFQSEIETFDSTPAPITFDPRPPAGSDGQPPRKLSFPNLTVADATDLNAGDVGAGDVGYGDLDIDRPAASESWPEIVVPTADEAPSDAAAATASLLLPTADAPPADQVPTQPNLPLPHADHDAKLPTIDLPRADTAAAAAAAPESTSSLPRIDLPRAEPAPTAPPAAVAQPAATGAFSAMVSDQEPVSPRPVGTPEIADLVALDLWLHAPDATQRTNPLLVAIEAMSLDEFESLPPEDAAMAREEIGSYLAETTPGADLVAYIDGPYFIVAHQSLPINELGALNKTMQSTLRSTNGTHAFLRPGVKADINEVVDEAVIAILQARQLEAPNGH